MRRLLPLSLLLVALATAPAFADPGIAVNYHDGLMRVTLDGSYAGTYHQVWRSGELVGQYNPLDSEFTLCTGDCFLTDQDAIPGTLVRGVTSAAWDGRGDAGQPLGAGIYFVRLTTPLGASISRIVRFR